MSVKRSWGLLLRQLIANRAFVLRRATREVVSSLLAGVGRSLPGAAAAALWLDPRCADAYRALALRAEKRGDLGESTRRRHQAERLARNTAEISILAALRGTFALRRAGAARGGADHEVSRLVEAGELEEAARRAIEMQATLASRIDILLQTASTALERRELPLASELLERARALDGGRPQVWRAKGQLALAEGDCDGARSHFEKALALDPRDVLSLVGLGDALRSEDPGRAAEEWWRALERQPEDDSIVLRLESESAPEASAELHLELRERSIQLELDQTVDLTVDAHVSGTSAGLYVIEPFGFGLECQPHGRIPLAAGEHQLSIQVRAARTQLVNHDRPWALRLALCDGHRVLRSEASISVPDSRPGRVFYLITEDHEVYDEREVVEPAVVRKTLVDKSRMAERIANDAGARWTHMVDVGSLGLIQWAAERSADESWSSIHQDCVDHLVEAVGSGNDLGLHVHAFHDPAWSGFVHDLDPKTGQVTTQADFLEKSIPQRGFWSRAFPALGAAGESGTRLWATWRGVGRLEALGRLGDPQFRVTLFRAGSLDYGEDAMERADSTLLLRQLEVLADSDVPKPRLYHRTVTPTPYPVAGDIRRPARGPEETRILEMRAEYNIESDFLSDLGVLNRYLDLRMRELIDDSGDVRAGVHIICCMTHDKFINWRMARRWDSLDPDYGDWATIRSHLRHARDKHPRIRMERPRDAVLEWFDHYTPELIAWRDEEVVELSAPDRSDEIFRYPIRLLGQGIPVTSGRSHRVTLQTPAWLTGRVREAWIERAGERWPSQRLPADPSPIAFPVDERDVGWELVVCAQAGDGIVVETSDRERGSLRLRSRHGYRRATVDVPEALSPDGVRRRIRNVGLRRDGSDYTSELRIGDAGGEGGDG